MDESSLFTYLNDTDSLSDRLFGLDLNGGGDGSSVDRLLNPPPPPPPSDGDDFFKFVYEERRSTRVGSLPTFASETFIPSTPDDCAVRPPPKDFASPSPKGFACPYLKYNPKTYGRRRGCRGASFATIHRLKEHLYRTHRQKANCPRCRKVFASEGEVKMHLLSATHCEVTGAPAIEGFDAEQERRLRSRKKVPGVDSEEDKWRQVFLILFPDCIEIPSSSYNLRFMDDETSEVFSGVDAGGYNDIERCLNREVPPALREHTFSRMEEAVGCSLALEKKRKLLDVSKEYAIKMVKQSRKGKRKDESPGVLGAQGLTTEHRKAQAREEGGSSSSTLANVLTSKEGKRGREEKQPTDTQNATRTASHQPEGSQQRLMDVSEDFAVKLLKHGKEDRARDKGKGKGKEKEKGKEEGSSGVLGPRESTQHKKHLAPSTNHATFGEQGENRTSSTPPNVPVLEESKRHREEAQPAAAQNVSGTTQPEGDLVPIPTGTPGFKDLDFGGFDLDADIDFHTLLGVYDNQTLMD